MKILKRLVNLWHLSNFEITKFDNQLVITKKDEELVFARPKQAVIIKKEDSIEDFLR